MGHILQDESPDRAKEKCQWLRRAVFGICEIEFSIGLGKDSLFFKPFTEMFDNTKNDDEMKAKRELNWKREQSAILGLDNTDDPRIPPLPPTTYGIKSSIFSTFVDRSITPKGEFLNIPQFKVSYKQYVFMADLAALGEHLNNYKKKGWNNLSDTEKELVTKTEEAIAKSLGKNPDLLKNYQKKLKDFRKKYGLDRQSDDTTSISEWKYLDWVIMFRNTFNHLKADKYNIIEDLRDRLWLCLPEGILKLPNFLPERFKKIFRHD